MPHKKLRSTAFAEVSVYVAIVMIVLIGAVVALSGCATLSKPIPTAETAEVCANLKIVRYSKNDTDATIKQIRANNAVLRKIYGC